MSILAVPLTHQRSEQADELTCIAKLGDATFRLEIQDAGSVCLLFHHLFRRIHQRLHRVLSFNERFIRHDAGGGS